MTERAYVEVLSGPTGPKAKTITLGLDPLTIGRHADNKLVLTGDLVSRFHCVVEQTKQGLIVRDLGSRNGTSVNGERVKSRVLENGDVVQVGTFTLNICVPGTARASATPKRRPHAGSKLHKSPTRKTPPSNVIPDDEVVELGDDDVVELGADDNVIELGDDEIVQRTDDGAVELGNDDFISDSVDLVTKTPRPGRKPTPPSHGPDIVDPDELEELDTPAKASAAARKADDALIEDLGAMIDEESQYGNPTGVLTATAAEMPDCGFQMHDIMLINAHGTPAHAEASRDAKRDASDAVELFRTLLFVCFRARATDIHVEPKEKDVQIRIRVDGSMVEVVRVRKDLGGKLMIMVKVMADIDIAQRNTIQEGHFSARVPAVAGRSEQGARRRVDYRVSFAPSVFGQKLVLRVQDSQTAPGSLNDLRMPPWMTEEMTAVSELDAGMILAVGPTGSGKTTSLYSLLQSMDCQDRNVVTIEDPVEIQIEGITQLPVDEIQGKTFSSLLKSVLRQDPDVILIGEIRDPETARTALQAAITGHLVLSTLHTKDSVGTIFRLLDLGVEPYMLAQGLQTVLAQRLVRQLCTHCKKPASLTASQLAKITQAIPDRQIPQIYAAAGCPHCLNTGYTGRRAIFELLSMNDALRDVIAQGPTLATINQAVATGKFERLATVAYGLVLAGIVSFEEVERVVGR